MSALIATEPDAIQKKQKTLKRKNQMIEQKAALRHIEELRKASLQYPPDAEGIKMLAKALAKHSESEEHCRAVVDAWVDKWPQWPKPADLVSMCGAICDPRASQIVQERLGCPRCHGTGFIVVAGPYGTTAAYSCTHREPSEADKRMGVRIHPSVEAHYRQEQIGATDRRELWVGSNGKPDYGKLKELFRSKTL